MTLAILLAWGVVSTVSSAWAGRRRGDGAEAVSPYRTWDVPSPQGDKTGKQRQQPIEEVTVAHPDAHLDADLAVTLEEDRPGTLAKAIECVSRAGINIDGYAEIGGVVHVLSPELRTAHACLEQAGFRIVQEHRVVVVPVADQPGAAAGVFKTLADAHINIKYSYLATRNRLVIAVGDTEKAIAALTGSV